SESGSRAFQWFSTRTNSRIADYGFDWDFDLTDFVSPHATPGDGIPDLAGFQKIAGGSPDFHFLSGVPARTTSVFGSAAVPSSALFTSAARATSGLVGSFVNSSLRAVTSQADWKTTQAIVGTRVDAKIDFVTNSLGSRSSVNVTGGTNSNWDFFSVQWDGYVSIPSDGVSLRTSSSDGSRLWIDINGDGQFSSSGNEYINNGWGKGQDVTVGPASIQLAKSVYKVRLQFEEGTGPNPMQLLWDYVPTVVPVNAYFTDAGKTSPGIIGSYVNTSLRDAAAPPDWRTSSAVQISGTRVDSAISFPLLSWGIQSDVGLTNGSDNNWQNFSAQWDGYVVIPVNGVRLFTRTDDGSRLWIDVNGDGIFANTASELLNNGFGGGQEPTLSSPGVPLAAGTYRIRMQYEEGYGLNAAALLWDYHPIQKSASVITGPSSSTEQRPTISWTPASGAVGYDIWINNLTTNTIAVVRTTTPETWLTPSQDLGIGQFAAWVRSVDINGVKSAWSPRFTLSINSPVTLKPLAALQTTAFPVFTWDPLLGADHYDVWVANLTTNETPYVRQAIVTDTQWSSSIALAMGRYRVWVRAFDAAGTAAMWSKGSDFVVVPGPTPLSPLLPTFDRTPTLSWSSLKGAFSYQVTVVNQNTSTVIHNVSGLTGLSWTVPADLVDGTYQWWVSGVSQDGYKSASPQEISFFVGGRPTVLAPVGNTSSTKPLFKWTSVIQAATYEIWVNRLDVATTAIIHLSGLTSNQFPLRRLCRPEHIASGSEPSARPAKRVSGARPWTSLLSVRQTINGLAMDCLTQRFLHVSVGYYRPDLLTIRRNREATNHRQMGRRTFHLHRSNNLATRPHTRMPLFLATPHFHQ
ncbi:MAG: PA14 domain-containing protein, partial [Planctomycetota bacterium]|nr:PA14 domain-containing protein [Planctomycetota bacterium]